MGKGDGLADDGPRKPRGSGRAGHTARNRDRAKAAAREYRLRINQKMTRLAKLRTYRQSYRVYLRQWSEANHGLDAESALEL